MTTATLDPAQPGPGKTYATPVTVNLSALDPTPAGPPPSNHDVDAAGTQWSPTTVSAISGDTRHVALRPGRGLPHDAWVVPPGGNPSPNGGDIEQVTTASCSRAGRRPRKTLTQTGTWTFVCRLHASFTGGAWSGMVGTAAVSPATVTNPPSGVDFTEYRVNGGAWTRKTNDGGANPFATSLTVSAEGSHTVEYRSADEAGNVEATKSVAFSVDLPDPGFPVIQAFADPSSGAAPLLVRFSAAGFDPDGGSLAYKWEFADGVVFGRDRDAHVHQDRDVHGQGDRHRRRGLPGGQGRPGRGHRSGCRAADGRRRPRTSSRGPAPLRVQFTRAPATRTCCTRGTSATVARRWRRTPAHTYRPRARTRPR